MGSNRGWIKWHRSALENELFNEKPFSRWQAFEWMCLKAQQKPTDIILKGEKVHLGRGQLIIGSEKMADIFGWSRNKVLRFLELLTEQGMIAKIGTPNGTRITVENYAFYQGRQTADGTPDGTADGTPDGTHEKNVKNVKNVKEREARAREEIEKAKESEQAGRSVDGMRHGLPLSPFGKFGSVMLTEQEHAEIKATYKNASQLVAKVDRYLANAERTYHNHHALIEKIAIDDKWPRRSKAEPKAQSPARQLTDEERRQLDQDIAQLAKKLGGGSGHEDLHQRAD